MSNDHIQRQLLATVVATCPGFNAILFVVSASTITEEIQATVDLMLASFGEDASEFAFLLLTDIANEKDKVEYLAEALSDANSKLLLLVSHCKHKILFIDNTSDKCSLEKMSEDIIEAICNNAKNNNFSNDCFKQVAIELGRLGGQRSMENLEDVNIKKKVLEESKLLEALYLVVKGFACFGKAFFYVSSAAHELYMKLGGIKELAAFMKK
ncbi:hypothetical protein DPMN_017693 [Dreissena polymorpha]|uniref:AIG1-type G domain-containing protein n=1 Tax=Dreissena polymorpha TaxID=45954 RepID=A0A9D4NFQ6_DREPO|nr:hypothetical protein DPMN_017693 [Dreissena polymorpha]